jgi:hypothetical protein
LPSTPSVFATSQTALRRPSFDPAGAVTGVGSLPLTSLPEALESVITFSPQVPFWPQLPQRSDREAAIGQGFDCIRHLIEPRTDGYGYQVPDGSIDAVIDVLHNGDGYLTEDNAAGFFALEQALASGLFPQATAVKGQIEGPITLAAFLFYKGRPFLSDPVLFSSVAFHVSQLICWQANRLRATNLPVLLFVDEPGLCLEIPGLPDEHRLSALAAILDDARTRGVYAGLHCCASQPFERMFRVRPDVLSFDAHEGLESFFAHPQAMDFVNQGGTVAYGLVPTKRHLDAMDAAQIFLRWLECASRAGDPQKLAQRAMITATCGLGLLEPESVPQSFSVAHGVSKLVRSLAGLPDEEAI